MASPEPGLLGAGLCRVSQLLLSHQVSQGPREKQAYLLSTFLLLHRGKPPLSKLHSRATPPGGPWLWFTVFSKKLMKNVTKKGKKSKGQNCWVASQSFGCLDTGPVSARVMKSTHQCAGDEETPCAAFEGGQFLTSS